MKWMNELFGTNMDAKKVGHFKEDEYEKIMHKMKPVYPVESLMKE